MWALEDNWPQEYVSLTLSSRPLKKHQKPPHLSLKFSALLEFIGANKRLSSSTPFLLAILFPQELIMSLPWCYTLQISEIRTCIGKLIFRKVNNHFFFPSYSLPKHRVSDHSGSLHRQFKLGAKELKIGLQFMLQFLFIEFPLNQLSDGNMVKSLQRSTTSILRSIYKEISIYMFIKNTI